MNLQEHTPIAKEAYALCLLIEALPASPQQTQLSIAASALAERICEFEDFVEDSRLEGREEYD